MKTGCCGGDLAESLLSPAACQGAGRDPGHGSTSGDREPWSVHGRSAEGGRCGQALSNQFQTSSFQNHRCSSPFLGHIFLQESDERLSLHSSGKCAKLRHVACHVRSLQHLRKAVAGPQVKD